jgi:large subunit ribosomal protein L15e
VKLQTDNHVRWDVAERLNRKQTTHRRKNKLAYKYMAEEWAQPEKSFVEELMRQRLVQWRKQPTVLRIEHPTRLDRARKLGYKAKQGFIVVRAKVRRGGLRKIRPRSGRRPKRMGVAKFKPAKSIRLIAEERTAKRFPNLEVLNSYWVAEDGKHKWFEVILLDPNAPTIKTDKDVGWILEKQHTSRVFRSMTSAGKNVRGLHHRGRGAEKARPSRRTGNTRKHGDYQKKGGK